MKGSVKLFIASLMVLAAAGGFFAGSVMCRQCPQGIPAREGMAPPPPPEMDGKVPPAPGMKGPKGEFRKGHHGNMGKGPSPEVLDSVMQVTPEQKAALEKHRNAMDSSFKALGKQKMEAEKALRVALDSANDEQINSAKKDLLSLQESMLDARIAGAKELSSILSKEQLTKLHDFQKESFKKHKKGPKGPKDGQVPPPPPQE